MTYISAVAERCYGRSTEACSSDPYCTIVLPLSHQQFADIKADPTSLPARRDMTYADFIALLNPCRPDLFRVLSKPCKGSRGDLLVRCGGYVTAAQCGSDPGCIWLRNGWWYEPGSGRNHTMFSGEDVDLSVLLQGGVPPWYACWPKWHVPYAAEHWPSIQSKAGAEPLVCPLLTVDYPCGIYTNASLHAIQLQGSAGQSASTSTVHSQSSRTEIGLSQPPGAQIMNRSLADAIGSELPCIDVVGLKGNCPHANLAAQLVAKLWKGWEVQRELYTQHAEVVADRCGYARVMANRTTSDSSSAHIAIPAAWPERPDLVRDTGTFGSQCMFDGCSYASYTPVDLPIQCRDTWYIGLEGGDCNNQTIGACRAKDGCITALTAEGLWGVLAGAVLGDHAAGSQESSFWLKGLAAAGERCGTLETWHEACSSFDSEQRNAYLTKVIGDYEKLFLLDARASSSATSSSMSCKPAIEATYKTLAALWIAYAAVLVLGFVGLVVYWHLCTARSRSRMRRRKAAAAYHHTLGSVQAQRPPVLSPQQAAGSTKLWRAVLWAMPCLRAVGFVVDVGLDVYTLVMVVSSRWFGKLLAAILLPYGLMALLVGPGIVRRDRSHYGAGLIPTCFCSLSFWPMIWWLDFRMVCSLLGVQIPCCGESRVAISMYTELRMLFEACFEGLPSALVSSAVLYDKLGLQSNVYAIPTAVLCISLASSFFKGTVEVWRLAVLTHEQGNCCFMTTIADMVWDMLPSTPTCQPAQPQSGIQPPAQTAAAAGAAVVTVAPVPMSVQQQGSQPSAGVVQAGKPPDTAKSSLNWVAIWTWGWLVFFGVVTVLVCISIGCVGLLVKDGTIDLPFVRLPYYRFAGDASCGAGSLFVALRSGSSCTLPNLVAG